MSTNFAKRAFGVVAVGGILALPAGAGAATISFDQIGGVTGTVTNNGGGEFTGENIRFDAITFGTTTVYCDTSGDANSDAEACYLNFDTAAGEFVVTAEIGLYDSLGVLLPGLDGSEISVLTGTNPAGWIYGTGPGGLAFGLIGTDTKLAELLTYFGITDDNWVVVNTEISNPNGFPLGQAMNITSADIDNTSTPVPEPGLLTLFGLGLVGLGRQVARRKKR